MHSVWMSCPNKNILLFDIDTSVTFHRMSVHPQIAVSHDYSEGQTFCVPIRSAFGANISLHNWEVFAQACYKKAERLQSLPDMRRILIKYKELIHLIKILPDVDKFTHFLVPETQRHLSTGVFTIRKLGLT